MDHLRRIAIVTGTRAEAGLLLPVMQAVQAHPDLTLQLIVAGMHLISGTHRDLPFTPAAKVRMQQPAAGAESDQHRAGQARVGRHHDAVALGTGVRHFAQAFVTLEPDIVVVLGDRIEAFAAATAAAVGGIRVAHLHGGDRAEGVADESLRHAISKLAHLHFPATAVSRRRLVRLGEHPAVIFNHGSPAVDGLARVQPADDRFDLIVMHHPTGADDAVEHHRMATLLQSTAGHRRLILLPNHDPGRDGIMDALHTARAQGHTANDQIRDHLPRAEFLSQLKAARGIVGNSSAGLIEAAVLRTPAVNVGDRQGGRETPASVISCSHDAAEISSALAQALTLDTRRLRHPYGRGDTGPRVADTLATLDPAHVPLRKRNAY